MDREQRILEGIVDELIDKYDKLAHDAMHRIVELVREQLDKR